jgi:DNA-binding XRE family transcriptional regulator
MQKNARGVLKKLVHAICWSDSCSHFRECYRPIWNRLAFAGAKCGSRESDSLCLIFSARPPRQHRAALRQIVSSGGRICLEPHPSTRCAGVRECRWCRFRCPAGRRGKYPLLFRGEWLAGRSPYFHFCLRFSNGLGHSCSHQDMTLVFRIVVLKKKPRNVIRCTRNKITATIIRVPVRKTRRTLRGLFGTRIRELRLRQKLTQEQLAERARISVDFLSLIERGRNSPSFENIENLARTLGCSVVDLFIFEERQR